MTREDFFYLIISRLRTPIISLLIVYFVSITGLILIPGSDLNGNVHYMSIFDAFFITVYTSTTVGFGELPYPWTQYQKLWISIITLMSVFIWIFSIGKIVSVLQDKRVKEEKDIYFFNKKLKKVSEDFYIICGFGNTGKNLIDIMIRHGANIVVIEKDKDVMDSIKFHSYSEKVLYISGDVTEKEYLKLVGVEKKNCKGLIITVGDDRASLKISLATKVLNPKLNVIARANKFSTSSNMESYDVDKIVVPKKLFSEYVIKKVFDNTFYEIESLLTNENFVANHCFIKGENWVIVDYKDYGKTLYKKLKPFDLNIKIMDDSLDENFVLKNNNFVKGKGVERYELNRLDINNIDVFCVTSDDDYDNLSSLITAKKINPNIKTIAVVNKITNKELFEKIGTDFIFQPYEVMVRNIFSVISEPLLEKFFSIIKKENYKFKKSILHRLNYINEEEAIVWSFCLNKKGTNITENKNITIRNIVYNTNYYKLNTIPLILNRDNEFFIQPNMDFKLEIGDEILFAGNYKTKKRMSILVNDKIAYDINKNSFCEE